MLPAHTHGPARGAPDAGHEPGARKAVVTRSVAVGRRLV